MFRYPSSVVYIFLNYFPASAESFLAVFAELGKLITSNETFYASPKRENNLPADV